MTDEMVQARRQLAQASQILAMQGVLDAFGHVSRRSPEAPDRFLISRNMPPALVTPDDVLAMDLAGNAISDTTARLFLERFLHAEIYRARPDVNAIVHSHAPAVLPFTIVPDIPVRPTCHMCGFLAEVAEPFDVSRTMGSPTDMLISDSNLGARFAEHLSNGAVALMRAHGFTSVGADVPQAVYRAIYTVKNCEVDLQARLLGSPTYLSPEEAALCERAVGTQADRPWSLWLRDLDNENRPKTT